MLTPRFELTQTENEVVVTVHAPYANIKDTEVYVEEYDFRFYSAPYYLRYKFNPTNSLPSLDFFLL